MRSEQINELATALAKAQAKFPTIPKDKVATIISAKGSYKYKYADLADVLSAIRPALTDNGLAIVQTVEVLDKGYRLDTQLLHASGQYLGSSVLLDRWPDPKQYGIEMSYMRRYQLCALVGVASDDDTDSDGLDTKQPKKAAKPEAPERTGLDEGLAQQLVEQMQSSETADDLKATYTKAYKSARDAGDTTAAQKFLEAYRAHPLYVAPEITKKAAT